MNIIVGLTRSEKIRESIEEYIKMSNKVISAGPVELDNILKEMDNIESNIMKLLHSKLNNYFKVGSNTYEELDIKLQNSDIRGDFFCNVNSKKRTKKIYKEVSKVLSPDHNVIKKYKTLLDNMKEKDYCVCWNLGEDEADELL